MLEGQAMPHCQVLLQHCRCVFVKSQTRPAVAWASSRNARSVATDLAASKHGLAKRITLLSRSALTRCNTQHRRSCNRAASWRGALQNVRNIQQSLQFNAFVYFFTRWRNMSTLNCSFRSWMKPSRRPVFLTEMKNELMLLRDTDIWCYILKSSLYEENPAIAGHTIIPRWI